jgi:hypothetical protein
VPPLRPALRSLVLGQVIHVYRQLKKLGKDRFFGLPKNDLERDVPLPEWAAAATRMHVTGTPQAVHAALGEAHGEGAHAQPAVPLE